MLQTLLETGARASELVQFRIEDVSLAERVVVIRHGKGDKRREVPMRCDLAQLLRLYIGTRRAGPLFASRQHRPDAARADPPACRPDRSGGGERRRDHQMSTRICCTTP
jgi:integrase/recombinase XerD